MSVLSLLAAAFAADTTFVEATIEADLGDVIDPSATGGFATSTISDRLDALLEAVDPSCEAEPWAGSWIRGRNPRLAGATETGAAVTGPSLVDGDVGGTAFSASLEARGRVEGTTDDGTTLHGHFTRIDPRRAFWYGIEVDCDPEPPAPDLFVERNLEITGSDVALLFNGLFVSDLTVGPEGGVLQAIRIRTHSIGTPSTCSMTPEVRSATNEVLAQGDEVMVGDEREIRLPLSSTVTLNPGEVLRVGASFSGCGATRVAKQPLSSSIGEMSFLADDGREFPIEFGVPIWGE